MISIMLDNDIAGHRDLFEGTLRSAGWDEYGFVEFITMDQAGIASDALDSEVWRFCQQRGLLLLTANRTSTTQALLNKPCAKITRPTRFRLLRSALPSASSNQSIANGVSTR